MFANVILSEHDKKWGGVGLWGGNELCSMFAVLHRTIRPGAAMPCWWKPRPEPDHHLRGTAWRSSSTFSACNRQSTACEAHDRWRNEAGKQQQQQKPHLLLTSFQRNSDKNGGGVVPFLFPFINFGQMLSNGGNLKIKSKCQSKVGPVGSGKILIMTMMIGVTCSSNEMTRGWTFSKVYCDTAWETSSANFVRWTLTSVSSCLDMTKLTFSFTTVNKQGSEGSPNSATEVPHLVVPSSKAKVYKSLCFIVEQTWDSSTKSTYFVVMNSLLIK